MKKFYEKSEIWFAVMWIIIYVVVMGNLRSNFGDESPYSMLGVLIIAAILNVFIVKNRLTEKYGLVLLLLWWLSVMWKKSFSGDFYIKRLRRTL